MYITNCLDYFEAEADYDMRQNNHYTLRKKNYNRISWKTDNFRKGNKAKKQRNYTKIKQIR